MIKGIPYQTIIWVLCGKIEAKKLVFEIRNDGLIESTRINVRFYPYADKIFIVVDNHLLRPIQYDACCLRQMGLEMKVAIACWAKQFAVEISPLCKHVIKAHIVSLQRVQLLNAQCHKLDGHCKIDV
jgi:hypothetical protein